MDQDETSSKTTRNHNKDKETKSQTSKARSTHPNYMFVGSGDVSENATQLAALIENDSGYGGSVAGSDAWNSGFRLDVTEDRPSPGPPGELVGESDDSCRF